MPGTRESVQGDRFCADLKLSTLPWTGRRSLTREALKAASTAIRSLPAYSPAEIEKLRCPLSAKLLRGGKIVGQGRDSVTLGIVV